MPHPPTMLALLVLLVPAIGLGAPMPIQRRIELRLSSSADVRAVLAVGEETWAATGGGLLRVDAGGEQRLFDSGDGLPAGRLHALLAEEDQSFWVGGDGGLVRIGAGAAGLRILQRVELSGVRALARRGERLLAGTWEQGLHSVGRGESKPTPHRRREGPLAGITALAVAGDLVYVASASDGLWRFDGRRLTPVSVPLPSRVVWSLALEGKRLWVGTLGGLLVLEDGRVAPAIEARLAARLPVRDLRALLVSEQAVLVGSFGGGAYRLRRSADARPAPEPLAGIPPTGRVSSLAGGKQGVLIGTATGLYRQRGDRFVQAQLPGPPSNDISTLAQGRSGLWVGTFDAGLALYRGPASGAPPPRPGALPRPRWLHFDRSHGLVDDWVNQVAVQEVAGREIVWVATPRGASQLDGDGWHRFLPGKELAAGHVNSLQVSGGRVVLASSKGVTIHENGRWVRLEREQGLPLRNVTAAAFGADGALWVGGMDGLARFHQGRWQRFETATGELPDDWVTALLPSAKGLWVGTYNRGLALGGAAWQQWREPAMPCGWVNANALLWSGEKLWIGTMEGGLLALSLTPSPRWRRLDAGLPSRDVTAIAPAAAGKLWVATRGGIVLLGR